jgi:Peptidase M50B-like
LRNVRDWHGEFAGVVGFHEYIPVVGRPVAYGIGFLVIVLLAFSGGVADSVVTVAHEGGHMITALMTGRGVMGFGLIGKDDRTDGLTLVSGIRGFGASDIIISFAGYATPPVAGLIGAAVVARGNSWGVLWAAIVLLLAVLLVRSNSTARTVTGLLAAGVLWAAVAGSVAWQAAVAVGVVWLLLIGGLGQVLVDNVNAGDVNYLSEKTWIPRVFWFAGWLIIAALCLWFGALLLLGYA